MTEEIENEEIEQEVEDEEDDEEEQEQEQEKKQRKRKDGLSGEEMKLIIKRMNSINDSINSILSSIQKTLKDYEEWGDDKQLVKIKSEHFFSTEEYLYKKSTIFLDELKRLRKNVKEFHEDIRYIENVLYIKK